jgi:hypothetical protein
MLSPKVEPKERTEMLVDFLRSGAETGDLQIEIEKLNETFLEKPGDVILVLNGRTLEQMEIGERMEFIFPVASVLIVSGVIEYIKNREAYNIYIKTKWKQ